ncbi:MAG TPA: Flp pilus assembly protein CpaB [Caulobacteraceae bacterium]|jgi:pilus assembly protein CpaB|nr:Flp pilus assembly protein CpaB [Caulobacteraceae bacterium]
MNRRTILVIVAIVISAGGLFLAMQWMRGSSHSGGAATEKIDPRVAVLVAKSDLQAGQFVRPENLAWQAWPQGPLPDSYFVQSKTRQQDFVGAVVRSHVAPGEPITSARVVRPGERGFMAAVLTPGERALTVNVTASTGVAGFVFPGDRVDVVLTMTIPGAGAAARHVSETILRDVRVVGMDQTFNDAKDDKKDLQVPKTATLELTPKQVEQLAVASDLGVLTLALRSLGNPGAEDASLAPTKTWDSDVTQITTRPAEARAAAPGRHGGGSSKKSGAAPVWTVDVVRGGKTTTDSPVSATGQAGRAAA